MPITVAIVGRPNVGKSTLFNRMAGKKLAIVDDTPGVTRDRAFAPSRFGGLDLNLVDTAGLEESAPDSLQGRMMRQTAEAIAKADVCIFLVDAREGVVPGDETVAGLLRRSGKPVILAANKSESEAAAHSGHAESYRLGLGEPIALSAEHGIGFAELRQRLVEHGATDIKDDEAEGGEEEIDTNSLGYDPTRPLRLAIVGRPNVGKSSLLNRLLGEDRALTSPEAGTTRDAVLAEWTWEGRQILLHDTAGLRKKARVTERLEKMSNDSTLSAIRFADCVIVAMDASQLLEKQDLAIADLVAREGRALVFAVNKWDLVEDRQGAMKELRDRTDRALPQVVGAGLIGVSALTGEGIERLMQAVMEADRVWNTRASTSAINRFLESALSRHPPPAVSGRRVRIRYMTQAKARPPTFILFGNQLKALPESYLRYIANELRESFGLKGTPIRFLLRESENPFAKD